MSCDRSIGKGEWRFARRMKASSSLRDQRNLHLDCLGLCCEATKADDLRRLREWSLIPENADDVRDMLLRAWAVRQGAAGDAASSSGAAASGAGD